jgi:ADP-ribose pyrophosphatase YjhB (NUDIX family)
MYDGKYKRLYAFLSNQKEASLTLSFTEIEHIIKFKLPNSAYKYPAWWANENDGRHTHARSWLSANWNTEKVEIGKIVTFDKQSPKEEVWMDAHMPFFIVNVEGAIFKDDKWLVIERSTKEEHAGGTISLVGGKVEQKGNTVDVLESTVKREIFEEVGVKISDTLQFVYSSSFVAESGSNVINVVFLCEYQSGEPYIKSPDEVQNVQWLTYEEIINHPKTPTWTKESFVRSKNARENYTKIR